MRILFIHQNFPGQFGSAAAALAGRGHDVVALSVSQPRPIPGVRHLRHRPQAPVRSAAEHPLVASLNEWHVKIARGQSAAAAMRELRASGFQPDIVVAHPGWGEALFVKDVFPSARLLVYAEFYYGGAGADADFDPEFLAPTSANDGERLRIKNTHLLHALNDCDAALSPTEFQRSRHPNWAQPLIQVIHDGIDTVCFSPDEAAAIRLGSSGLFFRAGDELVTFVSRQLEPYRGYHVFMRALPLIQRRRPKAHVVIVGGDGASYGALPPAGKSWRNLFLDEVASELDLGRVHFVGRVPHPVLTQLMQVSAVHVYLTYPFVLSWSLLEAMSIGCMVVGSRTAPVQEVIEDGVNGFLVDFFDHAALAHRVAEALQHRGKLQWLRANSRQLVIERFDLKRVCLPAQLALLEGLGASGHHGPAGLLPTTRSDAQRV